MIPAFGPRADPAGVCAGGARRGDGPHASGAVPRLLERVEAGLRLLDLDGRGQRRGELEALRQTGGNQTQAARLMGMPRRTLVHKLRVHGITRSTYEV